MVSYFNSFGALFYSLIRCFSFSLLNISVSVSPFGSTVMGFNGKHALCCVLYPVWGSRSFHASGWMRDGEHSTAMKVHAILKDVYFTDSFCNNKLLSSGNNCI